MAEKPNVYVKIDGVLASLPADGVESTWVIGSPLPHAREVIEHAKSLGNVLIYGGPCYSPRGQRAVQRWMNANGLDYYWVTGEATPPPDHADVVIASWPILSTSTKTPETPSPTSTEKVTPPPSTTSPKPGATQRSSKTRPRA